MSDEIYEPDITERTKEHFFSLRRAVHLNEKGEDFISDNETAELDEAKLIEFKRMMMKIIVAGTVSSAPATRLYEKMIPTMQIVAEHVRIIADGNIQTLESWKNISMPDYLLLNPEVLKARDEAVNLITSGKPFEIESLFTSIKASQEALDFIHQILGTNGYDRSLPVYNRDELKRICEELGIELSQDTNHLELGNPMEEAIYRSYAGKIIQNSILNHPLLEHKYMASGLMDEINTEAKNNQNKIKETHDSQ